MRKYLIAAAVALLPAAAMAQTATSADIAKTTAEVHGVHNDVVGQGNQLGAKLDVIHNDLQALLGQLRSGAPAPAPSPSPTPTPAPAPTPTPSPVVGQVAALTVGPGQAIVELADAIGNMAPGGVLTVLPGTYTKAFQVSTQNLTIKCSQPMKCVVDGQGGFGGGHRLAWGKACIDTTATLTIDGLKFVRCGSPQSGNSYSNEAAVYLDDMADGSTPTLTVRHSSFDNNANGIFSANALGTVVVDSNVFGYAAPNGMNGVVIGTANGPAHDMYLSAAHVEVMGNYFYGSASHNVKTRSPDTNIHDNPVMTYDGGRVADLSDGGKLTFNNNAVWSRDDAIFPKRTIQSGLNGGVFGNSNLLATGDEDVNAGVPTGSITNSTFNIARVNSTIWVAGGGALTASGNKVNYFGSGSLQIQNSLSGDLSGGSAPPGAPAHAPAPPLPPTAWFSP